MNILVHEQHVVNDIGLTVRYYRPTSDAKLKYQSVNKDTVQGMCVIEKGSQAAMLVITSTKALVWIRICEIDQCDHITNKNENNKPNGL